MNLNYELLVHYRFGYGLILTGGILPVKEYLPHEIIALDIGRNDALVGIMRPIGKIIDVVQSELKSERVIISILKKELFQNKLAELGITIEARHAYKVSELNYLLNIAIIFGKKKEVLILLDQMGKIHSENMKTMFCSKTLIQNEVVARMN